jgi:hypothetical protein
MGQRVPRRSDMKHAATQALYAYWNEVRRDRLAPRRLEIQPARIGDVLLDTFILERADRNDFRFRLAGTRVAARFSIDLKAQDFLACWREADRSLLEHHLEAISDLGRVGLFTGEGETRDSAGQTVSAAFELLVLPLVHTGQSIDRLLCLMVPLDTEPRRPEPVLRNLRLQAAEAIWPTGRDPEPRSADARQLPLHPNVRLARIVRQGRRQFRVYEGGLVQHPREGEAS